MLNSKTNFIFIVLLCVLIIPFISAKPGVVSDAGTGLTVITPEINSYPYNMQIEYHVHVYNSSGVRINDSLLTCNMHLYNQSDNHLFRKNMTQDKGDYSTTINTSVLSYRGHYAYIIECIRGGQGGFVSGSFVVNELGLDVSDEPSSLAPLSIIILLPLILAIIMMIGAATLDGESHAAIKIGLFLMSSIPFYISLYWGGLVVIKYYNFSLLTDAIANGVFWLGLMFVVIITYFIIYAFYLLVKQAAQKKEEKLNY